MMGRPATLPALTQFLTVGDLASPAGSLVCPAGHLATGFAASGFNGGINLFEVWLLLMRYAHSLSLCLSPCVRACARAFVCMCVDLLVCSVFLQSLGSDIYMSMVYWLSGCLTRMVSQRSWQGVYKTKCAYHAWAC